MVTGYQAFDPLTGRWEIDQDLWSDPGTAGIGSLPEGALLGQAAEDYWASRTIEEDQARMMAGLPSDPRYRRGFESMLPRLQARYLLAQPYMGAGGEAGTSFAQYLSDVGGDPTYGASGLSALRNRAQLAADVAMNRGVGEGAAYGATDPIRLAYEGYFGGGGQGARQSQMAVAQMLARQRQGGGQYRGTLGRAIGAGLERLSQRRLARGADPNSFLDWYLSQTAPPEA